jgi:hypothetical protein
VVQDRRVEVRLPEEAQRSLQLDDVGGMAQGLLVAFDHTAADDEIEQERDRHEGDLIDVPEDSPPSDGVDELAGRDRDVD